MKRLSDSEMLQWYLKEAYVYNRWRERVLRRLLTIVSPRMGRKPDEGYLPLLATVLEWLQHSWKPMEQNRSEQFDRLILIPSIELVVADLCKKYNERPTKEDRKLTQMRSLHAAGLVSTASLVTCIRETADDAQERE